MPAAVVVKSTTAITELIKNVLIVTDFLKFACKGNEFSKIIFAEKTSFFAEETAIFTEKTDTRLKPSAPFCHQKCRKTKQ
jgi:hypothetical protein